MDRINAQNNTVNLEYSLLNGGITLSKGQLGSKTFYSLDIVSCKHAALEQLNANVEQLIKNALGTHQLSGPTLDRAIVSIDAQAEISFKLINTQGVETELEIDQTEINKDLLNQIKSLAGSILLSKNEVKERSTTSGGPFSKVEVVTAKKNKQSAEVESVASNRLNPNFLSSLNRDMTAFKQAQQMKEGDKKRQINEEENKRDETISDRKKRAAKKEVVKQEAQNQGVKNQ